MVNNRPFLYRRQPPTDLIFEHSRGSEVVDFTHTNPFPLAAAFRSSSSTTPLMLDAGEEIVRL